MRDYYRATVLSSEPSRILIQMRGERWQAEPFAMIEGATVIESVEAFTSRCRCSRSTERTEPE